MHLLNEHMKRRGFAQKKKENSLILIKYLRVQKSEQRTKKLLRFM